MLFNHIKVAVTSMSFCRNDYLRNLLKSHFPNSSFNDGQCLEEFTLKSFLSGHDAAIVGLDPITRDILEALPSLKAISKYGVGLDNIDLMAVRDRGIYLGWTPGTNAQSVAELTLCFMLGLMRNVFCTSFRLKSGGWHKDGGRQLAGKRIGIIGCGNVGKAVVKLLQSFNCRILVNDLVNYESFYRDYCVDAVTFEELMRRSDVVSLHIPLDSSTRGMINKFTLKLMKNDAFLINTSRGAVVDTLSLKTALIEKTIAGAAIDVFDPEPPVDGEFLSLTNLIASPHIGGNSAEAVRAMGESAVDHLVNYFTAHGDELRKGDCI